MERNRFSLKLILQAIEQIIVLSTLSTPKKEDKLVREKGEPHLKVKPLAPSRKDKPHTSTPQGLGDRRAMRRTHPSGKK